MTCDCIKYDNVYYSESEMFYFQLDNNFLNFEPAIEQFMQP